jgi:hypothetical protein
MRMKVVYDHRFLDEHLAEYLALELFHGMGSGEDIIEDN